MPQSYDPQQNKIPAALRPAERERVYPHLQLVPMPLSVVQQLCRWLLLSLDRLTSIQLSITQELIAHMLGVRREGVTTAAGKLQRLGIIRFSRGQLTVLDRRKLERECCEYYSVAKRESDRLARMNAPDHQRVFATKNELGASEHALGAPTALGI